ncbi:MAG: CHAT domain-containing protein [Rubrivivax sp.]
MRSSRHRAGGVLGLWWLLLFGWVLPAQAQADAPGGEPVAFEQWQSEANRRADALAALERGRGERHSDTLRAMHALALAWQTLSRDADAIALFERTARLRTEVLGASHPDTLDTLAALARSYGYRDRLAEQLELAETVHHRRRQALGDDDPLTLESLSETAWPALRLGRPGAALSAAEAAHRGLARRLGADDLRTVAALHQLANVHSALGLVVDARRAHRQAYEARRAQLGDRHRDTLQAAASRAASLMRDGQVSEALVLLEQTARLRAEVLGPGHPATLFSRHALASAYVEIGRQGDAIPLLEPLLEARENLLGPAHVQTVVSQRTLAAAYANAGRLADAAALQERVVRWHRQSGLRLPTDAALAMHALSRSYGRLGRRAEQLELLDESLRVAVDATARADREPVGNQPVELHPGHLAVMAAVAWDWAQLARDRQAVELGLQVLQKVYARRRQVLGEDHPVTLATLAAVARLLARSGRTADALALSAPYVEGMERLRAQGGLAEDDRQALFVAPAINYRFFALLQASAGRLDEAFRLAQLSKARTLLEGMVQRDAGRLGALPPSDAQALEQLQSRLAAYADHAAQEADPTARTRWEAERTLLQREHEAMLERLRQLHPRFAQLVAPRLVTPDRLAAQLGAREVAVEFLVHGDWIGAFVVGADGRLAYRAIGNVPRLAESIEVLRRGSSLAGGLRELQRREGLVAWEMADGGFALLDARATPRGGTRLRELADMTRVLGDRLLKPLQADLAGATRWVVAPDAALAALPLELLEREGAPVLQAAEVVYTPSLSVHALTRERQQAYRGLSWPRELLAVGDPRYETAADGGATRRSAWRGQAPRRAGELETLRSAWVALPGTEREARGTAALFPGRADLLLQADASEARLQALQAQGRLVDYRYLLFATHGYLSPQHPALSSLVLSQVDLGPGTDGYLTAAEWPAYTLRSDLTVLSACDTGLGRVLPGEGVLGLPYAMFLAGNVNTVMTLWAVDDEASAAFVQALFRRLRDGRDAASALSDTKREFATHARWNHPRYWAPYVLVGAG